MLTSAIRTDCRSLNNWNGVWWHIILSGLSDGILGFRTC